VKRLIIAGVFILALAMAFTPTTGAYSITERKTISIVSGVADNGTLDVDWLNSVITITETDVGEPSVSGQWVVNDMLTFGVLSAPLVNLSLTISYPSSVVSSSPDLYPWNLTDVDTHDTLSVEYQKYGPGHELTAHDVDETITGYKHEVTLTINSDDKLEDASWNIYFADEAWDDMLATIDADTLAVEVNGHSIESTDWNLASSSLKIDNVVNIKVNDDNELYLTWTTGSGDGSIMPLAATPEPWYAPLNDEPVSGIPTWAILAIAIVVIIAGIAIWKQEK